MRKEKFLLILLVVLIFILNYNFIDSYLVETFQNYEIGFVERVIDGDTVVVNGSSIRLLGINSPEKGEIGYFESKRFLESQILEKEVQIHFGKYKTDKYGRKLGYIFLNSKSINLESVREGYSNFYFPSGKDQYYKQFVDAWNECLEENKRLCEKSFEECIILSEWDIKNQKIVLENICNQKINLTGWSVKDEGRKKYVFGNLILEKFEEIILTSENWEEKYVWTSTGDSIFVRDSENRLVIFDTY